MNMIEHTRRFMMSRDGIGFFKAVLESYEDVALLTVLDGKTGEVEVLFPAGFEEVVAGIIKDMSRYGIRFEEVTDV